MQNTIGRKKLKAIAAKVLEVRKNLEPHRFFVPNVAQRRFIASAIKEKWLLTGNGLGKTTSLVVQAVWHMTGEYPDWYPEKHKCKLPSRGGFSTTTFTNATEKGLTEDFHKWCPGGLGKTKKFQFHWDSRMKRIKDKKTGSVLDFFSYDQDPKDWAGPSKDYWLWDEHGTHKHYQECKRSLRGYPAIFSAGLTPTDGITWEMDIIIERADGVQLATFRGATMDNAANLPDDYIHTLTAGLTEDETQTRLYGDFIELSGLIYPQFDQGVHMCDEFSVNIGEPATWPKVLCIDPGFRNPCAALWATVDPDGQLYFYREYYQTKKTIPENVSGIVEMIPEDEGIVYVLIDPAARGSELGTGKTQLEQFEDAFVAAGKTWPVYPADSDIDAGIERVRTRLMDRTIHFFPGLTNTFKEFRRYVHKSPRYKSAKEMNAKEKPKQYMDHAMDVVKYIVADEMPFFRMGEKGPDVMGGVQSMNGKTGY